MANVNSTEVSNLIADPHVMTPTRNMGGVMRIACGTVAAAAGDLSAGDTIMLANVPANAAVTSIKIFNDDLDSGTTHTMHIGLYLVAEDGTVTVKDVDAYCSAATDCRAAVTTGTEVAFEARDINKMGQRVFEDAGDSSDSSVNGFYTIGFESEAAGDTAGDISYLITYVV
tara:strand:- start:50 stop:562 length:513 start_codon:yes stop_codon:yes gene_type:complete